MEGVGGLEALLLRLSCRKVVSHLQGLAVQVYVVSLLIDFALEIVHFFVLPNLRVLDDFLMDSGHQGTAVLGVAVFEIKCNGTAENFLAYHSDLVLLSRNQLYLHFSEDFLA